MSNIRKFPMMAYWEKLLELIPDAVVCVNADDELLYSNTRATQLLGFSAREFQDMTLNQLFDSKSECLHKELSKADAEPSQEDACELDAVGRDGEHICVLLSVNEVEDPRYPEQTLRFILLKDIRPLKKAERQLVREKARFESLFDNMNDAVFLAPIDDEGKHGNFVKVNRVACERLGYTREELLMMNARTINPNANLNKIRAYGRSIRRDGRVVIEAIHQAKDGTQIPVEAIAKLITIEGAEYVLSIVRDLREFKAISLERERFGKLMDHSWDEIYVFSSESFGIMQINQGTLENVGYSKSEVLSLSYPDIIHDISEQQLRSMVLPLFDGSQSRLIFEAMHCRKNGTTYPVEVRLQLSHDEVPPVLMANVQDITQRKQAEERLKYLANFDSLTGLPNRALFMDRLTMAMETSRRSELLTAVVFIDLDGFKLVNDTLGHEAGDLLIQEVSNRLSECVRKSDTVARLGGDEFTIILTNLKNVDGVDIVTDKILKAISTPFEIYDTEVQTSSSLGVTIFPITDAEDAPSLVKQADAAMYNAKNSGKNNRKYYSATLAKDESKRANMEVELKRALEREEFYLVYQPKIDLNTGSVTGSEALLRWENDYFGNVSPAEFVPILESSGFIRDVGYWVLETAVKQLKQWLDNGINQRVSINSSARQFDDGVFPGQVKDVLERYQVPGKFLEVEITEGLLLSNDASIRRSLTAIKELGVSISLDDFGTGYSSLSYLKEFPIDVIKIDRSFIMNLKEGDGTEIIDAIISLAKALQLRVTAEGVEQEFQSKLLQGKQCDEGQGYYYGRPMGVKQLEKLYHETKQQTQPVIKLRS